MRFLLIGASSGIGLNLVEVLSDHELKVICRSQKELPKHIDFLSCDVTDVTTPLPTIEGEFDGLVYLPGTINLRPFNQLKVEDFKKDWEVNFLGAARTIQHFLPQMKKDPKSSIVLISSVAAHIGMPFHCSIASAKGAVEAFGRSLAAELAPYIRVNVVSPSLTDTPLASQLLTSDQKKEQAAKRHPLHAIGKTKDICSAIRFLLMSDSEWVTGQVLHVDGGLSTIFKSF